MITFATFYIDSAKAAQETIARENVLLDNRNEYLQMIDTLFRSAAIYHPDCKKVILTDKSTDLSQVASDIVIYRVDIDSEKVMLGRLIAQLNYARSEDERSDIVFLDSDMLINGSLGSLFSEQFQVALTYRSHNEMPINGGVIFVSKHQKQRAVEFLEFVLTIYQEKYAAHSTWWGDQYALMDAISTDLHSQLLSDDQSMRWVETDRFKTLLVPCRVYNFSPSYEFDSIASRLAEPAIIHFKGHRKNLIAFYWNAYLAPYELSLPARPIAALKGRFAIQIRLFEKWSRQHLPYLFRIARGIKSKVNGGRSHLKSQKEKPL